MFGANCALILIRDKNNVKTDRNKIPFDPRYQGVPSGASKIIFKPTVC
jgi:hypothetical protein